MMWDGINQRKFPRVNYECLLKITKDGQEEKLEARTENVGIGGLCVVLDKDLGLFTRLDLEFSFREDQAPIVCKGSVVWVVKKHPVDLTEKPTFDTGIEFVDIEKKDKEKVLGLVQELLKS